MAGLSTFVGSLRTRYVILFVPVVACIGLGILVWQEHNPEEASAPTSNQSAVAPTPATALQEEPEPVGVAAQASAQEEGDRRYELSLDSESMMNATHKLRRQGRLRVCFEHVHYDMEQDTVSLGDVTSQLTAAAKDRQLSTNEKTRLEVAQMLLERGVSRKSLFGVKSKRYTGTFSAETREELLDLLTEGGPYQWKQRNGTYVVFPIRDSSLAFPVDLNVTDQALQDVVLAILSQAPPTDRISFGITTTRDNNPRMENARVPRLKVSQEPALDALCRAVEAAGNDFLWSCCGYKGRRNFRLGALPTAPMPGKTR